VSNVKLLLFVVAATALVVIGAAPAWATHVVRWGIDSPDGDLNPSAVPRGPVIYQVQVSLDGEPLAGWPMTVRVTDDLGEEVETVSITTDGTGSATFTIDERKYPAPEEEFDRGVDAEPLERASLKVELCDEDGCLYGTSTLRFAEPDDGTAPSSTVGATTERGSGGAGSVPWGPVAGGALVILLVGTGLLLRRRRH